MIPTTIERAALSAWTPPARFRVLWLFPAGYNWSVFKECALQAWDAHERLRQDVDLLEKRVAERHRAEGHIADFPAVKSVESFVEGTVVSVAKQGSGNGDAAALADLSESVKVEIDRLDELERHLQAVEDELTPVQESARRLDQDDNAMRRREAALRNGIAEVTRQEGMAQELDSEASYICESLREVHRLVAIQFAIDRRPDVVEPLGRPLRDGGCM